MADPIPTVLPENVKARFWANVDMREQSECWNWTGPKTKGYGYFCLFGVTHRAHRITFTTMVGPIPAGLVIDHKCRNRSCVNPDHLRAVDNRTNSLENSMSVTAINSKKTHCLNGHELVMGNIRLYRNTRRCLTCHRADDRNRKRRMRAHARAVILRGDMS